MPESIPVLINCFKSIICSSIDAVLFSTTTVKAAGITPVRGPSTATAGDFEESCSGFCTVQPIGGKNEKPSSSFVYFPELAVCGVNPDVLSGGSSSSKLFMSERFKTIV